MSRSLEIYVTASKGTAHRRLAEAVAEKRRQMLAAEEALPGSVPPGFHQALRAAATAAKPLISAAYRGELLEVAISITETPLGGWNASIMLDAPTPAEA